MGKYFVSVTAHNRKYKVCRDDIKVVFSCKVRKAPKLPSYHPFEKQI